MFQHIRKFSSTVKAVSPISVLYPKNNNKLKVVRGVMDQSFLPDEEEYSKKPAAGLLDQISLRPFELTDVDDIMLWATDDQFSRYDGWEIYTSKEDAVEDIKNNIIPHPWFRAICLKNRPIGKIYVAQDRTVNQCLHCADFGFVVAPKHSGKGIATTAVKMVLDTVFKECPDLERLEALVDVENLGSLRVLEKAGFLKEGVLRKYFIHKKRIMDMAVFSFLSTDFKRMD